MLIRTNTTGFVHTEMCKIFGHKRRIKYNLILSCIIFFLKITKIIVLISNNKILHETKLHKITGKKDNKYDKKGKHTIQIRGICTV